MACNRVAPVSQQALSLNTYEKAGVLGFGFIGEWLPDFSD